MDELRRLRKQAENVPGDLAPYDEAIRKLEGLGQGDVDRLVLADRIIRAATKFDSPLMRLVRDPARERYVYDPYYDPSVPGKPRERVAIDPRWDPNVGGVTEGREAGRDHYVWCYKTLVHHLMTHAAIVNRSVRSILARGAMDTWVRRVPEELADS